MEHDRENLLRNIDKLHTTAMGAERIAKNLGLVGVDVVEWCKAGIADKNCHIVRRGKNWYASCGSCTTTINARSFTIITAHGTEARIAREDGGHARQLPRDDHS